jgi:hypothetical protein
MQESMYGEKLKNANARDAILEAQSGMNVNICIQKHKNNRFFTSLAYKLCCSIAV